MQPTILAGRDQVSALATQVLLALAAAVTLVPVIWTVLSSLKSNDTIFAVPMRWLPDSLHWNNYIDAFEVAPFARYFLNSAIVAASVTATTVFFGAMAGYGFSKFRFPGRDLVFGLDPRDVHDSLPRDHDPLFVLVRNFGWVNTYWGLIIPGALTGFAVFMMRQFIQAIPASSSMRPGSMVPGRCASSSRWSCRWRGQRSPPRDPHVPGELE